jgi:uncharacterized membrane protein/mono/diheme cytochrome c family protein
MTVRAFDVRTCLPCVVLLTVAMAVAVPASARASAGPSLADTALTATAVSRPRPAPSPVVLGWASPRQAETAASPAARPRPWWGWVLLGRLHPMVVHFPIALLTMAAVIEMLHVARRRTVPSEAGTYCLAFGVIGALAAVCLGTVNAGHQAVVGEAAQAVERHQVMGWISLGAAAAALGVGQMARRARRVRTVAVYVGLVLATSAVVGATGHLGGGLVYGEDYLTGVLPWNQRAEPVETRTAVPAPVSAPASAPVTAPAPVLSAALTPLAAVPTREAVPAPAASVAPVPAAKTAPHGLVPSPAAVPTHAQAAEAVDFTRDVMPIFKRTCVECHGPDKVKARLRMDSVEALQKGGKSGALLKAGDPENSLVLRRVLGLDGEDQMPLDKDPLTEKQIDTLRRWIAAGAPYPAAGSQ